MSVTRLGESGGGEYLTHVPFLNPPIGHPNLNYYATKVASHTKCVVKLRPSSLRLVILTFNDHFDRKQPHPPRGFTIDYVQVP